MEKWKQFIDDTNMADSGEINLVDLYRVLNVDIGSSEDSQRPT